MEMEGHGGKMRGDVHPRRRLSFPPPARFAYTPAADFPRCTIPASRATWFGLVSVGSVSCPERRAYP